MIITYLHKGKDGGHFCDHGFNFSDGETIFKCRQIATVNVTDSKKTISLNLCDNHLFELRSGINKLYKTKD